MKGRLVAALIGMTTLVAAPIAAQASHYRLPVDNFISAEETAALEKAGVSTTLALLDQVSTPAKRQKLAKATGLSVARLTALAAQVDLLRIDGIGPSMVRLLNASGVMHAKQLAQSSSAALFAKVSSTNLAQKISMVTPREALIAEWIGAAKSLPQVVEGLP